MKLYLIRHGETRVNNVGSHHQHPNEPLSEIGVEQAKLLGMRLKDYGLERLIASPLPRAQHTAAYIAKETGLAIETHDDLREYLKPSSFWGRPFAETQNIRRKMDEQRKNPDYKYEDGETFIELQQRAERVQKFLQQQPQEHIACVSHAGFIQAFLAQILGGSNEWHEMSNVIKQHIRISNTSISLFEYTVSKPWKLLILNDDDHINREVRRLRLQQ